MTKGEGELSELTAQHTVLSPISLTLDEGE